MGKVLGTQLNSIPTGKEANQVKRLSKETPTPPANQDEGRPGRQRFGSETLGVDAKAFNRHRTVDTPDTTTWKEVTGREKEEEE